MGIVTCPDCNGMVSDSLPTCPHCGRPRPDSAADQASHVEPANPAKSGGAPDGPPASKKPGGSGRPVGTRVAIAVILGALVLVGVVALGLNGNLGRMVSSLWPEPPMASVEPSTAKKESTTARSDSCETIALCQMTCVSNYGGFDKAPQS